MSKIYPIRADESEKSRWQECADAAGLSFNAWAREALNSQVDLEKALARLDEPVVASLVAPVQSDFRFRPDPKTGTKKRGRA